MGDHKRYMIWVCYADTASWEMAGEADEWDDTVKMWRDAHEDVRGCLEAIITEYCPLDISDARK